MELELGLAISNGPPKIQTLKELDLISYVNYKGKQANEDENYSNLSSENSVNDVDCANQEANCGGVYQLKENDKKKRGFDETNEVESCVTLPLLLWDKHPNEDDKLPPKRLCNSTSFTLNKNDGDNIVGWPPIKSYRKKLNDEQQQQRRRRHVEDFPAIDNGGRGGGGCGGLQTMFVKVQIEGCFITRKIDLKLYHSYKTLVCSLLSMFGKGHDCMDDYKLTYQDEDGDWLLAGDVPWRTFIESVQRLKLRKKDD
uniref:Auxin-responsive protein n=1 Tax=Bassia scoparia TaxID=83154 RepID=A0A2R4K3K0_BASSC|nr:IAA31 [Bassia scoparia]